MQPNFSPFPYIITQRLSLRPISLDDDQALFFHRTDPEMNQYIERARPNHVSEVRAFIQMLIDNTEKNESIFWAISLKNRPELIGTICLWNLKPEEASAEVGYAMHPDFQGRGYMQEALDHVMNYGYNTLKANTLKAYVHRDNAPSIRVLENHGFVQAGSKDEFEAYVRSEK